MSIEQSGQLILLILNSVLMTFLSVALLGGAWLRQNTLAQRIRQVREHYQQIANPAKARLELDKQGRLQADLKKLRRDRLRLTNQYTWSRLATTTLNAVLLIFGVSIFALALRSLITFDSLISIALGLFTVGSAGLLMGTGCLLLDIAQGDHDMDSVGQSIGRVITQIFRQWRRTRVAPTPSPSSLPVAKATMVNKSHQKLTAYR